MHQDTDDGVRLRVDTAARAILQRSTGRHAQPTADAGTVEPQYPTDVTELTRIASTEGFRFPRLSWGMEPYSLLAMYGYTHTGSVLPAPMTPGLPTACYQNAWAKARRSRHLYYCEGVAVSSDLGVPMEHAWLWDTRRQTVIEPTWDLRDRVHTYLGLVIPHDLVREAHARAERRTTAVLWGDWARDMWFCAAAWPHAVRTTQDLVPNAPHAPIPNDPPEAGDVAGTT